MTLPSYRTPLASVVVPRFVPLGDSGLLVTRTPLCDPAPTGPGLAHLTYRDALAVAAANGARLPTREEVDMLHRVASAAGTELLPYVLPAGPLMMSRGFAERHDQTVLAAIDVLGKGADPDAPFANCSKLWIAGAPAGWALLKGWYVDHVERYGAVGRSGAGWVQTGLWQPTEAERHPFHDDGYTDYSMCPVLVKDA